MADQVRVRYAPSPTGHLHIGNARTALFNYLFARNQGGKFIIRIEDTDVKRNVAGGEESQLKYLKWLGINWDESVDVGGEYGPYRQTERLDLYRVYWQDLIDRGLAYRCYCTEEELEAEREEQTARGETPRYSGKHRNLTEEQRLAFEAEGRIASIRFRVPEDRTYTFDDIVKGSISFNTKEMGDFVIVKKDGIPTYNFAVAVDDHLMEISHVLRGEDHISNTPRQLMIYEALGWEAPLFGHMTLIVGDDHKKLSKRNESIIQFIEQYDQLGYLPEALFNYISLLGWSPEGEEEIFSQEELISIFTADRLSKSPAVFDKNKLAHLNNHYIKHADPQRIARLAIPHLQKAGRLPAELNEEQQTWAESLVALYQEQMTAASDIVALSELFFRSHLELETEAAQVLAEPQVPEVLSAFLGKVEATEDFTAANMAVLIKEVQKETGHKGKGLFMPIRVALTGQTHGRDLNVTIALLGRNRVIERLKSQIKGN
ncbi:MULTISPECIES: glutamate--tRNA ligase [unclassified Paenibacillus]|uniref:glutamate--tRNA ligase n=1 Tax=unclassified Paenibacillus TaxID=185978 RepID=UPI0024073CBA|nr:MULTISPECIES: glutamate--tRNA ligase [unclassified Paenibacillus]MDF9844415.1 nondiscriminating glutamyl-tRNA synthetase [Paenibacillus sp. PastF-2]MDF9851019.1 nondiscriminating glutamyl-tRNA synthetase [Paenibacillus sp. PastM-2]MDF9857652.1 nondiscriminating glutamyl-tRNA synthetase [Paenibacillus sp. PastF-1]MDH6482857.1 nondiscriminating glutamyl-tRNA synthetase [Paenibacillus sp. PastH-2]MDH6510282.1 nondiscriminating glutamyl-tRNA synthetase [Paenibacillus sp. PastM-3]